MLLRPQDDNFNDNIENMEKMQNMQNFSSNYQSDYINNENKNNFSEPLNYDYSIGVGNSGNKGIKIDN